MISDCPSCGRPLDFVPPKAFPGRRRCINCGLPFSPSRGTQRYCSKSCRRAMHARERRARLVNVGRCTLCGAGMPLGDTHRTCAACRSHVNRRAQKRERAIEAMMQFLQQLRQQGPVQREREQPRSTAQLVAEHLARLEQALWEARWYQIVGRRLPVTGNLRHRPVSLVPARFRRNTRS